MNWRWSRENEHWVLRPDPPPEGVDSAGFIARGSGDPEAVFHSLPIARAEQVHGARLESVRGPGVARGADALVSETPGLALVIRTADCVPLILAHPGGRIAMVHAGWRGLDAGIVEEGCAAFPRPGELQALIGPAIGPCCFEVGEEVAGRFPQATLRRRGVPRPRVDLAAEVTRRLLARGMDRSRIRNTGLCTRCHQHLLHSHRGSGGRAGRILAFAVSARRADGVRHDA